MPDNDILRFILVLVALLFMLTLAIRLLEFWMEISRQRGRIEEIKAQLDLTERKKEIRDDNQDHSRGH